MQGNDNKPGLKILGNNEFIEEIVKKASLEELYWLHGLLSGIIGTRTQQSFQTQGSGYNTSSPSSDTLLVEDVSTISQVETFTVLYATQSGNSRKVAKMLETKANELHIPMKILDMADYPPHQLKKEKNVIIICSTQGEGDPPLSAEEFYEFIHSPKVGKLEGLHYAVLALGDKSYVNFCKTGKDIDERLHALGAKRIAERVDCDVNFKPTAEKWINDLLQIINSTTARTQTTKSSFSVKTAEPERKPLDIFTRTQPGNLLVNEIIHLNGRGSHKDTLHIELADEEKNIFYQPGDSLGIYFKNSPLLVNEIISYFKSKEDEMIIYKNVQMSLKSCLSNCVELTLLNREFLNGLAELTSNKELKRIIEDSKTLSEYIYGRDVLDVLKEFKIKISSQQLVDILYPLQPRLYSIASSLSYLEGEVHLTVGKLQYTSYSRNRVGMCSGFMADQLKTGDFVSAFVNENENFRLPDNDAPIIMIAQGTGIAPYRAFMQEIESKGKTNKTWLFFGNPHFTTDFLYQTEWQQWYKKKLLSRIDLAWSRDQEQKIYVQHRLQEKAKDVFS